MNDVNKNLRAFHLSIDELLKALAHIGFIATNRKVKYINGLIDYMTVEEFGAIFAENQ